MSPPALTLPAHAQREVLGNNTDPANDATSTSGTIRLRSNATLNIVTDGNIPFVYGFNTSTVGASRER